jgi:hypothetical protein
MICRGLKDGLPSLLFADYIMVPQETQETDLGGQATTPSTGSDVLQYMTEYCFPSPVSNLGVACVAIVW